MKNVVLLSMKTSMDYETVISLPYVIFLNYIHYLNEIEFEAYLAQTEMFNPSGNKQNKNILKQKEPDMSKIKPLLNKGGGI